MIKWLKIIFTRKKDVKQLTSEKDNFDNKRKTCDMTDKTKFEIELYEEETDDNGNVKGYKKVISEKPIIIEAANKKELDEQANIFKKCGQQMKIVKVIDKPNQQHQQNQSTNDNQQVNQIEQTDKKDPNPIKERPIVNDDNIKTLPVKYYTIGDIEVKDDNGKIYQRQWVRLTTNESKNIRLVNETTNKIINTNGKCFEMKKWVLIETSSSTEKDDMTLE